MNSNNNILVKQYMNLNDSYQRLDFLGVYCRQKWRRESGQLRRPSMYQILWWAAKRDQLLGQTSQPQSVLVWRCHRGVRDQFFLVMGNKRTFINWLDISQDLWEALCILFIYTGISVPKVTHLWSCHFLFLLLISSTHLLQKENSLLDSCSGFEWLSPSSPQ